MTSTETLAEPQAASPDREAGAHAHDAGQGGAPAADLGGPIPGAWAMLRMLFVLLLQPHRWAEFAALEETLQASLAEDMKARLLALPELAHLRGAAVTVRTVWRRGRLDFDVLDADGRSLLDPSLPDPDRGADDPFPIDRLAILRENLRTARLWIDYRRSLFVIGRLRGLRRNPLRRGRMLAIGRRQLGFRVRRFRAARFALRRYSAALRAATLAVAAPP